MTGNHKLGVFASGAGSNAEQIIKYFNNSIIASVALIICNKKEAGVLKIAENHGIDTLILERDQFFNGDGYLPILKDYKIDFLVLAGFLWKIPQTLIDAYPRKIVNIHPALLPKYGGKGMYGSNVHQAIIDNKEKLSGITIHYVDEHYDNGDIIFQDQCTVDENDTPETLAERIHQLEHKYYPIVIEQILNKLN